MKPPYRPLEMLSHREREITPEPFARYLVAEVRRRYGAFYIAALFVRHDSPYWWMPGVDCWDKERNAYGYDGEAPVIAHPPCGPWGRYRAVSHQDKLAGPYCLDLVDQVGGVVEQPANSSLFRSGEIVRQGEYGHRAEKLTRLYWG